MSTQDATVAREERYLLAIYDTAIDVADPDEREQILEAVLAVADQEQARLRAERDAALAPLAAVQVLVDRWAMEAIARGVDDTLLTRGVVDMLRAALADPECGK